MPGKKECSFVGCKSPHNSRQFYQIDGRSEAGGQDWTELGGAVLCDACYTQFRQRGRLERNEPLCGSARRCSYEGCKSPHNSSKFYQIDGRSEAGGQDWTELGDAVLCHACYKQFNRSGTLERREPLCGSARRCSYEGCRSPHKGSKFHQIDGRSEAGGQDWTELAGAVLCRACYKQFRQRGTLERREPLCGSARRCSYEGCKSPHNSSQFHLIDGRSEAGGQDWTGLGGAVLCNACYNQFFQRGTLERTVHRRQSLSAPARTAKKRKASHDDIEDQREVGSSSSSSSSSSGKKPRKKQQEQEKKEEQQEDKKVEAEEEYDGHLEQCFMCFGSGTRVCIVPCGHSICGGCVEEGLLKISKTQPLSECPVCREEMCEPWVMEGDLWVELGGTPFDP